MAPENRHSSIAEWLRHQFHQNLVMLVLLGLCCTIELVLIAADHGVVGTPRWRGLAYQNGAFWSGLLYDWRPNYPAQPWTMFFTYAFLHGGLSHLAGNMLILCLIGPAVAARVGQLRLLVIYVFSAIGGAVGFALLGNSTQPVVGASGALFGLAGALLFWEYADRKQEGARVWPLAGIVLALVLMNLGFWVLLHRVLAWEAHLAGFIAGGVSAIALSLGKTS